MRLDLARHLAWQRQPPVQSVEATTRSCAIFVPANTALTDRTSSIERPQVIAENSSHAAPNAERRQKPMPESSRIGRSGHVFIRWFALKPMEPKLLITSQKVRNNPANNYALPNCFIENDRPDTSVSHADGLLYR